MNITEELRGVVRHDAKHSALPPPKVFSNCFQIQSVIKQPEMCKKKEVYYSFYEEVRYKPLLSCNSCKHRHRLDIT